MRSKIQPWKLLSSQEMFTASPWVKVHKDSIALPSGRIVEDYYRVVLPEYVVIYATRDDGKVLIERKYRHALRKIVCDLPAGFIEKNESPVEAAKRELLEETGYRAGTWKPMGSFLVDGNRDCGKCHFYEAQGLERVAQPEEDDAEEIEVRFLTRKSLIAVVTGGDIPLLATVAIIAMATNSSFEKDLE
jgi:ADP-ribose pyrophosphatase